MKENNELTRDDIAIDHDMEVDCDEGREITVYSSLLLVPFQDAVFRHLHLTSKLYESDAGISRKKSCELT